MTAQPTHTRGGPLAAYRVLDLSDRKGALGPKFLAEFGADVIRVEPPDGDPMRRQPPYAGDIEDPERGLLHLYRNVGKRGVTLNLDHAEGRALLESLVRTADVLYESFDPGYLDARSLGWSRLHELNPRLIQVSITEFGEDGPRKDWRGAPITAFAMSGAMSVSGWPTSPPCNAPHPMAYDSAVAYANVATMMAIWSRHASGEGQHIEVSVQEAAIAGLYPWEVPTYSFGGMGALPPAITRGGAVATLFECRDGHARMLVSTERHWDALLDALGNPPDLGAEEWRDNAFRAAHRDVVNELITGHTQRFAVEEFVARAQSHGVPVAAVRAASGFMKDPNTRIRGFWAEIDHPVAGRAEYPGSPVKMSRSDLPRGRPAPRLGEHNAEVFGELGLSEDHLLRLREAGAI